LGQSNSLDEGVGLPLNEFKGSNNQIMTATGGIDSNTLMQVDTSTLYTHP